MSIQEEIEELKNSITLLHEEIAPLQDQHDRLFREVSELEATFRHKNIPKPVLPKKANHPLDLETEDAPNLIHHSHFDASIEKYFPARPEEPTAPETTAMNDEILAKIQSKTAAGQLALKESIFRFGGITAFAINNRLYDEEDDALLGLRFDVLSHTTLRYLKPHYIILRRRRLLFKDSAATSNHWLVFRYTTPPYVPLDRLHRLLLVEDEAAGLQAFVEKVRELLVSVQYKHDKFNQLSSLLYVEAFGSGSIQQIVTNLERDLECKRVVMRIKPQDQAPEPTLEIELICGHLDLEQVTCNFQNENAEYFVQCMLQGCEIQRLKATFKDALHYMRNVSIL